MKLSKFKVACVVPICLVIVACTHQQIIDFLNIAAQAVAIAVPIITSSAGLPAQDTAWVSSAVSGLQCVSSAIDVGGTKAVLTNNIVKCSLNAALPVIPPGTPANVVKAMSDLSTAMDNILKQYPQTLTASRVGPTQVLTLSGSDRKKLLNVRKSLADSRAKLVK